MFSIALDAKKELANDWGKPEILSADLGRGDYLVIKRFGDVRHGNVFDDINGRETQKEELDLIKKL